MRIVFAQVLIQFAFFFDRSQAFHSSLDLRITKLDCRLCWTNCNARQAVVKPIYHKQWNGGCDRSQCQPVIRMNLGLSSSDESEKSKEMSSFSSDRNLPETCIIVSKERMLLPGMVTTLHMYDQNNIAALNEAFSRDGTFSLVRFDIIFFS
jgi:hypothetical protein